MIAFTLFMGILIGALAASLFWLRGIEIIQAKNDEWHDERHKALMRAYEVIERLNKRVDQADDADWWKQ